ncbi:topoisomerase acting in meiosis protein [Ceratobasidium sp. AG-Ba]|nr:topoisomerase acting in meiosis protein [Ceratobasidium sp. AG-Ba]
MSGIESPDFGALLFEDETDGLAIAKQEPSSPPALSVFKREDGDRSESDNEDAMPDDERRQYAIERIEEWVLDNLTEMSSGKPTWSFNIASRRRQDRQGNNSAKRRLLWPRKGCSTLKTMGGYLAQATKIAEAAHQALRENVSITKRDIFYGDIPLFGKQVVVDILVDDLAATWGLRRADLNIRAALKGIFAGSSLAIHLSHGEVVSGLDQEPTLIPVGEDIENIEMNEKCRWVVVIEKEQPPQAAFQTLLQLNFVAKHVDIGPGVIITGKGYPDIATRQLVAVLSAELPEHIPILALVDGDPHGHEILATYKLGSKSMGHENDELIAPRLEWIGVSMEDIEELGIDSSKMIAMTTRDKYKATKMLGNPDIPLEHAAQLETMLDTEFKAEIEVVSATRASGPYAQGGSRALEAYLHGKITTALARGNTKTEPEDGLKLEDESRSFSPPVKDEPLDTEYLDFDD